jgi:hypothetical protein
VIVRIIALTSKGEEAIRKYIKSSEDIEKEMNSLSSVNPKRLKFRLEQAQAKKIVSEDWFENPLRIEATLNDKFKDRAYLYIPKLEIEFNKIMLNSSCGKNDYSIEVL